MATSPSLHGDSSSITLSPMKDGMSLRKENADVTIRGRFYTSSGGGNINDDDGELMIRLAFHVCRLHLAPPPSLSVRQDWQCTFEAYALSEIADVRRVAPEYLLGRPVLGDDDADTLVSYIEEFVGGYRTDPSRRPGDILHVDVNVLIDERIPQLQTRVYEAEEEGATSCTICLEEFGDGEEVVMAPCAHPYHPACLGSWLQQNPRCPLCRSCVPFHADFESVLFITEHAMPKPT